MEVNYKKHAVNLIKMKTFHNVYPHDRLNTSKGVIRSRELSLATLEEIKIALGKQEVIDYKNVSIRRGREKIQTRPYILTFNKTVILTLKIG